LIDARVLRPRAAPSELRLSHALNQRFLVKECVLDSLFAHLLEWLALPSVGLGAIFVISALAATILPLGSEPVFLAYLALKPEFFWTAVLVATAGNSLGGFITYWMGAGAHLGYQRWRRPPQGTVAQTASQNGGQREVKVSSARNDANPSVPPSRAQAWVHRFGAPILLLAWLPVVGDPLCAMAGWLRLPWLPCLIFMMIGKCARYLVLGGILKLLLP
jgi:membrane protein YqaA with SNARE-associated domain